MELASDQSTCLDVDECALQVCGEHLCSNTVGSYNCVCKEGFEMIDGVCQDTDECVNSKCERTCSNSVGSFSCHCNEGFQLSEDGFSCEDINECLASSCKFKCLNTEGSFLCACPNGYQLDRKGDCFPINVSSESSTVLDEIFTESLSSTVELQHESPQTNAPPLDSNATHNSDGRVWKHIAGCYLASFFLSQSEQLVLRVLLPE
ncbi:hypothetical protein WMY93_017468 [Mugilogobius chulae]|uniref:EGF-like domain-containing protein n=1 Tax=Mugilogobius chulae TaxID=88201 RepID=A0AAW0NNT5_9GOBI